MIIYNLFRIINYKKTKMTHHTFHFPKTADGWKRELLKAIEVLKLNKVAMKAVAADQKASGPALVFIVLSAFLTAFGNFIFPQQVLWVTYRPSFAWIIGQTLALAVGMIVIGVILSLIAEHGFGGKGKTMNYLKVYGFGALIGIVGVFPGAEYVTGLWMLVVAVIALKVVHKI